MRMTKFGSLPFFHALVVSKQVVVVGKGEGEGAQAFPPIFLTDVNLFRVALSGKHDFAWNTYAAGVNSTQIKTLPCVVSP